MNYSDIDIFLNSNGCTILMGGKTYPLKYDHHCDSFFYFVRSLNTEHADIILESLNNIITDTDNKRAIETLKICLTKIKSAKQLEDIMKSSAIDCSLVYDKSINKTT